MLCDKCGYENTDGSKRCLNCGAELGQKMSDEQLKSMIDKLSDNSDALTVSPLEKILKWIFFACASAMLVLCFILSKQIWTTLLAVLFMALAGVMAGYPSAMWALTKMNINLMANASDATPSDLWATWRRVSYWVLFAFSILLFYLSTFYLS